MRDKRRLKGFSPVIDKRARILILGSFPGPTALARNQYYGYPGNHFWKIVFGVIGEDPPADYRDKIDALRRNRIALWDVISNCCRKGASDTSILRPVFNDIPSLIRSYPGIRAVFCNGRKAHSIYSARYKGIGVSFKYLPSTSPANAGHSYDYKLRRWRIILRAL